MKENLLLLGEDRDDEEEDEISIVGLLFFLQDAIFGDCSVLVFLVSLCCGSREVS